MRTILLTVLFGLLAVIGIAVLYLLEAHWEIQSVAPGLPDRSDIYEALATDSGPVGIRYINTASQSAAGRKVIHPSYVIEWADGRIFLIEVGMDEPGAAAFGRTMERFLGSEPIAFHGSAAARLGPDGDRIAGIAVSHLHIDHTGGIREICAAVSHQITVFQTEDQATKGNYVTDPGFADLDDADCVSRVVLEGSGVHRIVDFPGLVAVAAGGHTPGSTVYFAKVGETIWVMAGDIAWTVDDIRSNTPKPAAYSALIVPEYGARMEELRLWLKSMDAVPRMNVVVSHGEQAVIDAGMEPYEP